MACHWQGVSRRCLDDAEDALCEAVVGKFQQAAFLAACISCLAAMLPGDHLETLVQMLGIAARTDRMDAHAFLAPRADGDASA
eukprot:15481159-Alexandrium_andersonii.AAC.1